MLLYLGTSVSQVICLLFISANLFLVGLTLSSARSYSNILILFMGWFMLLDSVSMLFILLKLIGKVQVGMTAADFLLMACLTSPLEVLGMIFYNFIQKRFNLNCKQMIIIHLVFYLIFPIYYFIGTFLNFGFDSKAEVYILKLVLIFPYSHLSSVQRVLLSNFIPAGRETEFFSLNQVFGRGTAWIGPLLVGSVESFTGNIRYGFIFPIVFMIVGLIFLLQINVERGLDQAKENSLSGAVYEMLEVDS
jgi:UMF1 family MFS transporter